MVDGARRIIGRRRARFPFPSLVITVSVVNPAELSVVRQTEAVDTDRFWQFFFMLGNDLGAGIAYIPASF